MRLPALALATGVLAVAACRTTTHEPPRNPEPRATSGKLSGLIDGRPFTAAVAFAHKRVNDSKFAIDINVYEHPMDQAAGCDPVEHRWRDGERALWVQMQWPDREGRTWDTHDIEKHAPGVFFTLSRAGRTSERVQGNVTIVDIRDNGGTLKLDVVSDNDEDIGIRGAVAGDVSFTICPG